MNQEKIKQLLSESARLLDERKELNAIIQEALKKDKDYINMVEEKKQLNDKIKEYEESLVSSSVEERSKVNESLKLIKENLSQDLELKKRITNKLITFYKTKFDTNEDDLDVLATVWLSLFND